MRRPTEDRSRRPRPAADDRGPPTSLLALGDALVRALVESAPEAIVAADEDGRVVLVNRRAEALFGYARGELLGQPVELLVPELPRVARSTSPRTMRAARAR